MVLDLLLRGRTKGKASLDGVMRQMYDEFYLKSPNASYYLRGKGYRTEDFQRVASQVAGFALDDFFKLHVRGVETLPYDEAFGYVGLRLTRTPSPDPFTGISLDFEDQRTATIDNVRNNSPAEDAGLQQGDEIIELAGKPLARDNWSSTLGRYKPGDSVPITVKRDRRTIRTNLVLGQSARFEYKIEELPDATAEEKALRVAWLKGD
jgi:predicted metalloprotease with PDZ domain